MIAGERWAALFGRSASNISVLDNPLPELWLKFMSCS